MFYFVFQQMLADYIITLSFKKNKRQKNQQSALIYMSIKSEYVFFLPDCISLIL